MNLLNCYTQMLRTKLAQSLAATCTFILFVADLNHKFCLRITDNHENNFIVYLYLFYKF